MNTPDPTAAIVDATSALDTAAALVAKLEPHAEPHWAVAAVAPLAALLYDASPAGAGGGIQRARALAADPARWHEAVTPAASGLLTLRLTRLAKWNDRQRNSVRKLLTDALA